MFSTQHLSNAWFVRAQNEKTRYVPLPLRPTLAGAAAGGATPPPLTGAERSALTVIAAHVRERVQLKQVWIYAEVPGEDARVEIEDVARVSTSGKQEIPDSAARVIALGAVRDQRRLGRGAVSYEGGVHLVTAETNAGRLVAVVASGAGGERPRDEAEVALLELADIAARVLADPNQTPFRREPAKPASERPSTQVGEAARREGASRPVAYGAGLAEALTSLRRPPVWAESKERLTSELGQRHPALGAAIRTVETDPGLALALMATANSLTSRPRDGFTSVPEVIRALGPRTVLKLAEALPVLQPGNGSDALATALARLSGHALATRGAADIVARRLGDPKVEELRLAALLHDIGKVALAAASAEYLAGLGDPTTTPEERIAAERRRLGLDHATIGAVVLRRLGLPKSLCTAVERHHADDAGGPAAIVRLADMVAHQSNGDAVSPTALGAAGRRLGIEPAELQRIIYDLPRSRESREPSPEPSPLTPMQQKVLVGLSTGRTYKQIAADLSVSESTVRTHLHNLYGKLEVSDRAQAVLLAAERGWI